MVNIASDNPKAEELIREQCEAITLHGGFIDEHITIKCENNNISVIRPTEPPVTHILKVPHNILIPFQAFELDLEGHNIVIKSYTQDAMGIHVTMMENMLALFNETNKIKYHKEICPFIAFKGYPEITDLLLSARGGKDFEIIRTLLQDKGKETELILHTFFKTRLMGCRLNSRDSNQTPVLIPVTELLNHNIGGAEFDNLYTPQQSFLCTLLSPQSNDQNERFTNYGRLDSLDTYINYSFIDENVPYVRSIPMEIDLKEFGKIKINGLNAIPQMDKVPEALKGLKYYLPVMHFAHKDKFAELSHLFIPGEKAPFAMHRILEFTIRLLNEDISDQNVIDCLKKTETTILNLNESFYEKLQLENAAIPTDITQSIHLKTLRKIQIKKIQNYKTTKTQAQKALSSR